MRGFAWVFFTIASAPAWAGDGVTLTVAVTGARSDVGTIACALFAGESGFPDEVSHAIGREVRPLAGGAATCTFADVPPGPVAVAVIHDEDGDLTLDRAWYGAPIEGYGFSNGAQAHAFSPARFTEAVVSVQAATTLSVALVY